MDINNLSAQEEQNNTQNSHPENNIDNKKYEFNPKKALDLLNSYLENINSRILKIEEYFNSNIIKIKDFNDIKSTLNEIQAAQIYLVDIIRNININVNNIYTNNQLLYRQIQTIDAKLNDHTLHILNLDDKVQDIQQNIDNISDQLTQIYSILMSDRRPSANVASIILP